MKEYFAKNAAEMPVKSTVAQTKAQLDENARWKPETPIEAAERAGIEVLP